MSPLFLPSSPLKFWLILREQNCRELPIVSTSTLFTFCFVPPDQKECLFAFVFIYVGQYWDTGPKGEKLEKLQTVRPTALTEFELSICRLAVTVVESLSHWWVPKQKLKRNQFGKIPVIQNFFKALKSLAHKDFQ